MQRRPTWKSTVPAILVLMALSLAIIALARPINGYEESEEMASSRNLIIALDISRSMETQDVRPSRLEEARAAAYEVINALPSDKIGLIVFSGEADLVVPLTHDHLALKEILSHVSRDWMPMGGTNFGIVLEKAMQDLQRSAPTGSNALIIFSDGEDTMGEDSKELAAKAKKNNLLVITVGVGTETGGAIPDANGENGLYQDQAGKHVISRLKIPQLQQFADATGGDFFIMGAGADLGEFAQRAAEKIDRHDDATSINKVPRELFFYFLLPTLILMLLALILSTDWRKVELRRLKSPPLLLLALLLMIPNAKAEEEAPSFDVQGLIADLQQKNYSSALARLEQAKAAAEGQELNTQLSFAQGIAAMQQADKVLARKAFSRALLSEDKALQAAATYQLSRMGNDQHFDELRQLYMDDKGEAKEPSSQDLESIRPKFEQDIKNFQDALSIKKDMAEAQLAVREMQQFLKILDEEIEKKKQQEQQEQNQDNQDQQDNQDEQNQDQQEQDKQDQQDNQDEQDQDQQEQDKQDQQDNQDEQNQDHQDKDKQDQQDNQDEQNQDQQDQDKQDQQDKQDEQNQDQQNQEDKQDEQQQPEEQKENKEQEQQEPEEQQAQEAPQAKSEEDKQKDKARSILNMNLDEEKGSPVPRINVGIRPPAKDY